MNDVQRLILGSRDLHVLAIQGLGSQPTVWQNTRYLPGRKSVWTGSLGWLTKGPGSGGCIPHEPGL